MYDITPEITLLVDRRNSTFPIVGSLLLVIVENINFLRFKNIGPQSVGHRTIHQVTTLDGISHPLKYYHSSTAKSLDTVRKAS